MTTPQPTFYDPLQPGGGIVATQTTFMHERWVRVGATPDELRRLFDAHARRTPEQQFDENYRLRTLPDDALRAELDSKRSGDEQVGLVHDSDQYTGPAREVLAAVGDDPAKAHDALAAEGRREGGPRRSVIEHLEKIAARGGSSGEPQVDPASGAPVQ